VRRWTARLRPVALLSAVIAGAIACASGPASRRADGPGHQRHGAAGRPGTSRAEAQSLPALQVRLAPYRLPTAVSGAAVSRDGSTLLVAGGLLADSSSSRSVIRIDPRSGRSAAAGQLALPVHDAASAVLGGKLLIFGGGLTLSYAAVQRPSADGGMFYGNLPAPRSDLVAVTQGKTAYIAGGHGGSVFARTVLATTDGRHFRVVARLPVPVRYPGVAAAGGNLWIFGGLVSRGPVRAVQCVNLRTGRARLAGRLPHPLAAAAAFALDGTIYVAGGLTTGGSPGPRRGAARLVTSAVVLRFDQTRMSFSAAGPLPVPVAHAAVAVSGRIAYLVGGLDGARTVGAIMTFQLAPRPDNPSPARRG
jgi:hypothetical protein